MQQAAGTKPARVKSGKNRRTFAEENSVPLATPADTESAIQPLVLDYRHFSVGRSMIVHADCFEWLSRIPANSIHAVVTDPPYGVKEYDFEQLEKRSNGNGGIWRIPPSFDGHERAPLPRFTALNDKEREHLRRFFIEWSKAVLHATARRPCLCC